MNKNFIVDNAVGINDGDHLYDLHNFYDFKELRIDATTKVVTLIFRVNEQAVEQAVIDMQASKNLLIKFKGVTYFELSPNFASKLTTDLEELGYKNAGDMDIDWLIDESKSTESDHLLFRFTNDEFIRICAEKVHCSVD